jgi:predicted Zn-dependent peptidase
MTELNRTQPPALQELTFIELPAIQFVRLPNEIPAYIINTGQQDVLKLEFIFKAGRWNEPARGVAMAVSSLLKDGTSKHTALEIAELIEFYGATLNTQAHIDTASVTLFSLNKHLDKLLPLVKEILTEAIFPEKELSTYITNSKQKLLVNLEKVEFLGQKMFTKVLYGNDHPIGYTTAAEDFEGLKTETLKQFYSGYFRSNDCKIIMAGKIEDSTLKKIEELFGGNDWKLASKIRDKVQEVKPEGSRMFFEEKPEAVQSAIRIGKRFVNKKHPDYSKLKVLNMVYGGYFGSRLMSNLREDKGFCYGIYSSIASFVDDSYLCISTEVGAGVTSAAVKEIYSEIERLRTELIPEEELHTVKNYMMGTLLSDADGPFNVSELLRGLIVYDLNEDFFYRSVEETLRVTPNELRELAHRYFDPETLVEAVVGKKQ